MKIDGKLVGHMTEKPNGAYANIKGISLLKRSEACAFQDFCTTTTPTFLLFIYCVYMGALGLDQFVSYTDFTQVVATLIHVSAMERGHQ